MNNKRTQQLVEILLNAKNAQDMFDLLRDLLTMSEIEEISTRLQIVKMLKQGIPQREIAEKLKVGIATVTRGSREIKLGRFSQL